MLASKIPQTVTQFALISMDQIKILPLLSTSPKNRELVMKTALQAPADGVVLSHDL